MFGALAIKVDASDENLQSRKFFDLVLTLLQVVPMGFTLFYNFVDAKRASQDALQALRRKSEIISWASQKADKEEARDDGDGGECMVKICETMEGNCNDDPASSEIESNVDFELDALQEETNANASRYFAEEVERADKESRDAERAFEGSDGYDMGGPSTQQKQTINTVPSAALDDAADTTSVLPIVERGNFQVL